MKLPEYKDPDGIEFEVEPADARIWLSVMTFCEHFVTTSPDLDLRRRVYHVDCTDKTCQFVHHYIFYDLWAHGERVTTLFGMFLNSVKRCELAKAYRDRDDAIKEAEKSGNKQMAELFRASQIPRGDFDYFINKKDYHNWIADPEEASVNVD